MQRGGFLPSGCSKHPGELLQQYCCDCVELLCVRCIINTGETHRPHKLLDYRAFLQQHERKAKKLLHRLNEIRVKGDHLKTLLNCYDSDFKQSYEECEASLTSFDIAREEILKWQSHLMTNLEAKKVAQLKILDEAIEATKQGQLSTEPITVHLPKVTINMKLQSKLPEKIRELVPKSFSNFIRANSDLTSSGRKLASRVRSHDNIHSLQYDDDVQSIFSLTSLTRLPQRSISPSIMSSDSYYDEIDELPASHRNSLLDSLNLGETAAYSEVSTTKSQSIDDRPKMPTPTEKNAPASQVSHDSANTLIQDPHITHTAGATNLSEISTGIGVPYDFPTVQKEHDAVPTLSQVPQISHLVPSTEPLQIAENDMANQANFSVNQESAFNNHDDAGLSLIGTVDSKVMNNGKSQPKEGACNDTKEMIPVQEGLKSTQSLLPSPPSPRHPQPIDETNVLTKEMDRRPQPYQNYVKAKTLTNSPISSRKIYSSPSVSPIAEQPYDTPVSNLGQKPSIHPLSANLDINNYPQEGKNEKKQGEKEEPIYDSLDYTLSSDYSHNEESHQMLLKQVEYSEPYDWRKQPSLASYQQIDPPVLNLESYTTPIQSPRTSHQYLSPENNSTLLEELTIPPAHIILASCFAESFTESVSLFDICVNSDGIMIFSDRDNNCLRCLLGTQEDSMKKSKYFSNELQPRALTYDNSNRQIIMATNKGLYQVECSTHLSKMKEKKIAKNVIPLSMACSTVPIKKKGVTSLYMTLWPRNGDSCVYQFDTNGEFESKINSPDINNKKPLGIDYMKEYLVVTNLEDGTIIKMSHKGDPLWDLNVDARTSGILDQPFGVAIIPGSEYVAVTEPEAHRVSIFTDKGMLFLRFGKKGTGRGEFDTPRGIAVRLLKELVVVDSGNKRIQIFYLNSLPGLPTSFHALSDRLYRHYSPYEIMTGAMVLRH